MTGATPKATRIGRAPVGGMERWPAKRTALSTALFATPARQHLDSNNIVARLTLEIDALQQEIKTIGDGARLIKIGLRPLFNLKIINLNNKLCEAAGRFAGR